MTKRNGRPLAGDPEAIVAEYVDGLRVQVIAQRHGVSTETVRKYARDAGATVRSTIKCRCRIGFLCANCAIDVPLTGGRWVLDPVRRVQVWQASPEPDLPVGRSKKIQPSDLLACPTCGASATQQCKTKAGNTTEPHVARILKRRCPCGVPVRTREAYCDRCREKARRETYRQREIRTPTRERRRVA